jgi:predicted MPP superfamily phosphohydrolase
LRIRNYSIWKQGLDRIYTALTPAQWPARLAWQIHPWSVAVEEHAVPIPVEPPLGRELRIAFASDFHAGAATPWPLIEIAVARLHDLRADVLLLGGDFVSIVPEGTARVARLLSAVPAPFGRFAVLGNHDLWAGASIVVRCLQDAGIELLTNRSIALPPPFDGVSICGLDDYTSGDRDAARAFAGARPIRVVLMHEPSSLLDLDGHRFDLALCGHTHGGQIALPDGSPIVVGIGPLSRRYNAGRYALDSGGTLLVSRGVGCGTLPIRLNSPSGVLLCRLQL